MSSDTDIKNEYSEEYFFLDLAQFNYESLQYAHTNFRSLLESWFGLYRIPFIAHMSASEVLQSSPIDHTMAISTMYEHKQK